MNDWLKKLSLTKKAAAIVAFLILGLVAVWQLQKPSTDWIYVGKGGPEEWADFPYRLVDFTGKNPLPATHPDLTALTLSLQASRSINAWVFLPVSHCYAPSVRNGVPSVMCDTINNSNVFLAGRDNVREVLLGLADHRKLAAVQGRALGLYADTPVIWVFDPLLKPIKN